MVHGPFAEKVSHQQRSRWRAPFIVTNFLFLSEKSTGFEKNSFFSKKKLTFLRWYVMSHVKT
jgi:hypothetical protein